MPRIPTDAEVARRRHWLRGFIRLFFLIALLWWIAGMVQAFIVYAAQRPNLTFSQSLHFFIQGRAWVAGNLPLIVVASGLLALEYPLCRVVFPRGRPGCPGCGYDTRGLTHGSPCPECGSGPDAPPGTPPPSSPA